jgi:hypothetical protein
MAKREADNWVEGIDCFSEDVTCPHCLEIDEDRCDFPSSLRHDGDKAELDCQECGKTFTVTMCVEYTFQSEKKP